MQHVSAFSARPGVVSSSGQVPAMACGIAMLCAVTSPRAADAPQTFVYACDDAELVVRLEDDAAWVFAPGETLKLPHVPAGSGARYEAGEAVLWMKGQEAMFTHAGHSYHGCRNNPARAVWEDAKLRGVDFRAVGNEPGWYLEISGKTHLLLVTDYGQNRYRFEAERAVNDQTARSTTYTARGPEHGLEVVIAAETCHDTMSGEAFASTVTLWLDEKPYHGCGRPLH
jgi:membrane-bound inhibitor of C-type lysozyme/uncharacterized membrane protein